MRSFALEFGKLGAFLRRDFLTAITYRAGFVTDWFGLAFSAFLFYFTGRLVDSSKLPSFGGHQASYLQYVIIGVGLGGFVTVSLARVAAVMRQEQFQGTLESLLMTPTASLTVQLGSVLYDFLFIPVRIAVFVTIVGIAFGLGLDANGVPQAVVYLFATIPFVWGLGLISAGTTMTMRQGGGIVALGAALLMLGSGAYFPTGLLPGVLQTIAEYNPLAIATNGMREALIGGGGWGSVAGDLGLLLPLALGSLVIGSLAFRLGVRRERRRGTLGLY